MGAAVFRSRATGAGRRVGVGRRRRGGGVTTPGTKEAPGFPPRTPPKGRFPLDPRQGQWPLEPFILAVEQEGPTWTMTGLGRPLLFHRQGTDFKGPRPLMGSRGNAPGGFEGRALAHPRLQAP